MLHDVLDKVMTSDAYLKWSASVPDNYLAHMFCMLESPSEIPSDMEWQVGFYNPSEDTITVFVVSDTVTKNPESEVFKKEDTKILPLIPADLSLTLDTAVKQTLEFTNKTYPNHPAQKVIIIIQHLDIGQVFNITITTATLHIINVRKDTKSGEVLNHSIQSIFDFKAD